MTTLTAPGAGAAAGEITCAPAAIDAVRIRGFRSLADVELTDLPQAVALIGANGSGKSNVIRFFEMLSWMTGSARLGDYVARHGGADDQLFGGNGVTPRMVGEVSLRNDRGRNDYRFALAYGHPDRFFFAEEAFRFNSNMMPGEARWEYLDSGHREAEIVAAAQTPDYAGVNQQTARVIVNLLRRCAVYQFHDTSDSANIKKSWDVEDCANLRRDGGNLAAVLYRLEREHFRHYNFICRQIARVLPGFDRFDLVEQYGKVALRWRSQWSDKTFGAHLTSDGSLRFFALATLFNLPPEMLPNVILLDEPELGLHPSAVNLVGGLINSMSVNRQVVVATQSPQLVDCFDLDQICVLNLDDGQTRIRQIGLDEYRIWLDDGFSPGELWNKNLLGGRP